MGDPYSPQTTLISKFCIDFCAFIVGENRDIIIGMQVDLRKYHHMDD